MRAYSHQAKAEAKAKMVKEQMVYPHRAKAKSEIKIFNIHTIFVFKSFSFAVCDFRSLIGI